ncbi:MULTISPECIES: filamentous haemagglutinin family protein [Oxalobacteraceae]|uniref:filamentous haemagglutinin family protein n=1 Tax=Herminiimonas sp. Marseille-P9896 TaxID=2742211 RepID=UPI001588E23A|nr:MULTISPECIES: filamentous haemagglutinin family protein [Oxalobacteraceae]
MPSIRPAKMNPAFFNRTQTADAGLRRMKPLAHAIALMLATGSVMGDATAQQAFSAAWYAQKGAVQAAAVTTGKLPNGMPAMPASSPALQQQQANTQLQRSLANLNSAARAIALQQARLGADRLAASAGAGSVPDGLGAGGLDAGSLVNSWINAHGPTQSTSNGKTIVDIKQTADKAILNWETFNIGKNTILNFDQQADWSVLNRINNSTAPSVIQGQIKAPGTVMIVNANGIIFTGSSQVNTRNLVVAAAHILDSQFNTGIYSPNLNTASFTGANGNVLIESGAQIATHEPTSVTSGGGYVLVMGKEVHNAGEITTRKGQTTLAAGDSFFIRKGVGTEGNTYSTTRGNEVAAKIDAGSNAGKVTNTGLIIAREGDVTLTGRDVQQNGVAVATTTVNTRGTIHLLNSASDTQGSVTLGEGSTTAILIEDDGKSTALDSQRDALIKESAAQDLLSVTTATYDNLSTLNDRRDQSRIEIVSGGDVHFAADSLTLATGGQIAVSAKNRTFVADKARLDVSGAVGVNVAMESNNVKVNIQGNELRDSPDNRDSGSLFNSDIWLDRRDLILVPAGTGGYASDRWYAAGGLLEVSGYLSNQGHSIGEWAAQGGTVTLGGSEVITQQGSAINLSGGSYNVQTGMVNQTWLKGSDGKLYRIGEAPAGVTYTGVYKGYEDTSERWGAKATKYYYNPLIAARQRIENGYTVGRDAGNLVINAPTAVLEGEIVAKVYQGEQQTRGRDAISDGYKQAQTAVAKGATISLGQYTAPGRTGLYDSDVKLGDVNEVTIGMAARDALDPTRINTVWLDSQTINDQHLAGLDLGTRGNIVIDKGITLNDGGKLNLIGANIDIAANVTVRGGTINASNMFLSSLPGSQAGGLSNNGSAITLHTGATLDVSGRWVNTLLAPTERSGLAYLNGGSVKLESTRDVKIEQGSLIDASSGAAIQDKGKLSGGKGGSVSLLADVSGTQSNDNGVLTLDGEVRGYGVAGGGTLKLETGNAVVIGAASPTAGALNLDASRLQTGFGKYDINGHAGLQVADGAKLDVLMPVYRVTANGAGSIDGRDAFEVWTPEQYRDDPAKRQMVQRAGADLVLRSQRMLQEGGDVVIGHGAVVSVDPGRSISLQGGGKSSIVVDGTLNAWGGNIAIGIDAPLTSSPQNTSQQAHNRSIWIGETGVLDVAARAATGVTNDGRRYGSVMNGGSITLGGSMDWESKGVTTAPDVAIIIRPGALLDASGSSAKLDIAGTNGRTTEVNVASNGGDIVLKSAHSIYIDGTLRAHAGGANAAGGTLAVALDAPIFANNYQPVDAVRAQRELILSQLYQDSGLSAGLQAGQADPALGYGKARLSVEQVNNGGFGNLSLFVEGLLSFDGSVNLNMAQSMRLYAGSFGLADTSANDASIKLASAYVRLAGTTKTPGDFNVIYGVTRRNSAGTTGSDASFAVEADLVEIRDRVGFGAHGTIAQQNGTQVTVDRRAFDEVDILSRGDLRLLGGTTGRGLNGDVSTELASMGNITLTAAQIYPATGVSAQIVAGFDDRPWPNGKYYAGSTLEIKRYGDALVAAPLSVFGTLALGADIVRQGGVVRAPMGNLILGQDSRATNTAHASVVELLAGSLTSVSGAGVVMPYGGTIDGIAYDYAGKPITPRALGSSGIKLTGNSVIGESGSVLDLSGGGELTGAGFVTGRGGSVDIIRTPLVNANPAFNFSKAGNGVYAIVPSFAGAYAPVAPDAGYGDPMVGRQVTFEHDVAGLKAGTYTLMPSTYALLPGAFRIELGAASLPTSVAAAGNGSYVSAAYLGVANTSIMASLPNQVIVTPGSAVRKHSSFNETSYDAFVLLDAAKRGSMRGAIAADAATLTLDYKYSTPNAGMPMLQFEGTALFNPVAASNGFGGTLAVSAFGIEVLADNSGPTAGFSGASLLASDLNAFGAARMIVGGTLGMSYGDNFATFAGEASNLIVRSGAQLRAAEVFLVQNSPSTGITVEQGASINTIGQGKAAYDSSDGVVFSTNGNSVLGVSNGWINLLSAQGGAGNGGTISIGKCNAAPCSGETTLYGEGTLAIATDKSFTLEDNARYGAKNLLLALSALNLGSDDALAQAEQNGTLPAGLSMNQGVLDRLLAGNAGVGVPAVESVIFNARESINIYGSVALDTFNPTTGKSSIERLVFGTPAIYGYGTAGDKASITTGEFIWTGAAITPTKTTGEYLPNTPGAAIGSLLGDSTLDINAQRILFGYGPNTQPNAGLSADRLALGFGAINLNASERVTSNGKGTLGVYHRQGDYIAGKGYQYTGGDLNINAPLLTGAAASVNSITVGGALKVLAPSGSTAGSSDALGAELKLSGNTVHVDTAVVLPSGKLTLSATEDLTLGEHAQIDLSGRAVKFFEQTRYSWGGDLSLLSSVGDITQSAGSIINLSAQRNRGGTLKAVALGDSAGHIDLAGTILGSSSGWYDAGGTLVPYDAAEITLRAQSLSDFAALNARLNDGGVFGARRFQIKQGDLTINDEVKARQVEVVVDGGNLTVDGRIDASGFQVGSIYLAAKGNLTVNGTLDAHGTGLRVDSKGQIIDSPNRAIVDLTTKEGMLTLGSNAHIDLRAGTNVTQGNDGVARGTVNLSAPRLGGVDGTGNGANDVAVTVNGTPVIAGAKTVAVYGFRSYDDAPEIAVPDVNGNKPQEITQEYFDGIKDGNGVIVRGGIDPHNTQFIDAALANTALGNRLAGLGNYHLRPGVEIVGKVSTDNPNGDVIISRDLDLSGYRYGPNANRADPALRGFGEPGMLVIRAAGDINIYGSINDGFAPPPTTPDDKGWYLTEARWAGNGVTPFGSDIVIPIDGVVLEAGTQFPQGATLNYDLHAAGLNLPGGTVLPVDVELTSSHTLRAGTVLAANVYNANGSIAWAAGTVMASDVTLSSGMKLGAGTALRSSADVAALVWPKGYKLPVAMSASIAIKLARGALIPAMTRVELLDDKPINLRPEVNGVQGANWALAPMLGKGASSWSLQLTAGADMASADRRAVDPAAKGSIILADTHAMTRVEVKPGGTGFVWTDQDPWGMGYVPGTPVGVDDTWICDVLPEMCGIDPARKSYTWGPDAVPSGFEEGTPVDPFYVELGICDSPGMCVVTINPVRDITAYSLLSPMFSVLRTGTGDIGMAAAGDFRMQSAYGVYTAGTPSATILDSNGVDIFNQPRGLHTNNTLLGAQSNDYSAALAAYQAWYPEQGGNLSISAGRNITGDVWGAFVWPERVNIPSAGVGNWLWRQGTGSAAAGSDAVPTAWWINFGAYAVPMANVWNTEYHEPYLVGFTGLGTLGGGNLNIEAGGDAGVTARRGTVNSMQNYPRSQALVAAVGSTGRVDADGKLILTGGGDLNIRLGGVLNPDFDTTQVGSGGANAQNHDLNGALINLRGKTSVAATAIGDIKPRYRQLQTQFRGFDGDATDVRTIDPFTATVASSSGGITLVPGDTAIYLDTLGDLVLATVADPGRTYIANSSPYTANGTNYLGGGQSWFSLWDKHTAINLFAAGGNLTPGTDIVNRGSSMGNTSIGDLVITYPSILRATAANGNLYYGFSAAPGSSGTDTNKYLVLAPSASGALEFLAGNSIYGGGYPIAMSGSDTALPTPFNPAFVGFNQQGRIVISNLSMDGTMTSNDQFSGAAIDGKQHYFPLFAFGPDTLGASALHAGDTSAALFYGVNGDVIGVNSGVRQPMTGLGRTIPTWYRGATAARILAGRDVISTNSLFVHNNDNDISLVQAGRDILYANVQVAGPGTLEISAGRNLTQDARASVVSLGGLVQGDTRPGADIAMMAGGGINGPDFSAISKLYLDPANLADPGVSLASQPGKVVKTYEGELATWLKERFGFSGTTADALAYFNALAPEQQRVFLRNVYYAELREGGREYNNPDSRRYNSFLRSRDMIATLFPDRDAHGDTIVRAGDITMFGNAGVHTNFGGNIQMMAPGGQIVIGVQGEVPASTAGVVTQGRGDIQLFSEQSLLLGLSRVMTTFGGDIFAWSEQGDINAGRGSKTTVLYTPPKRVYDQWGNVTLSPQVPSSGAGIATLSPVPEASAGNVDLIAPLGTIDAGEAGIRVSGNVNIFALQVVNAANIKVAGEAKGIPMIAAVNVGALSNASAAASSAAAAAQDVMQRDRNEARKNLPSIFTVRVLGFGNDGAPDDGGAGQHAPASGVQRGAAYDQGSAFQVLGQGNLDPAQLARLTEAEQRRLKK